MEAIKSVFIALLKRKADDAYTNMAQCERSQPRDNDQEELERLEDHISENIERVAFLHKVLKWMVSCAFINAVQ
jgi:Mg2+ and Co2+ transporter CorA